MSGFVSVHKNRWGAGRSKGRRQFAADVPGFPHAAEDDVPIRREHEFHGPQKRIAQFCFGRSDRCAFQRQNFASFGDEFGIRVRHIPSSGKFE